MREQLQAILASRPFATALRARRFLNYIVEQTLAGRTDAIKELVLGIEVFDRPANFDPKIDTIVRVEAGRLRKRLEDYYSDEGVSAELRIEVPLGTYVPQFKLVSGIPTPELPERPANAMSLRPWYSAGLALILLALVAVFWWTAQRAPDPRVSIAVLPFLDLSPEGDSAYLGHGLSEEITDALCNAGGMRVASRTSAFSFEKKQVDVREIGEKLHVGYLVEGSIRKQGDQIKVTAQLIRTDDGYHVWSQSFERSLDHVFVVQQEIARAVVSELQGKVAGVQTRRIKLPHIATPEAFNLYLQAKYAVNQFGPIDLVKTEALFQQAITADPAYAPSYVALAQFYGKALLVSNASREEIVAKARAAALKALQLDEDSADGHALLGLIAARHDYAWGEAERHLRRAIELNPSSAVAHYTLAHSILAPQQRWKEALEQNRLASELDPLTPLTAYSEPWLAMLARRNTPAIEGFRKLTQRYPKDQMAAGGLMLSLVTEGDYTGALDLTKKPGSPKPLWSTMALIGFAEARRGNRAGAEKMLQELKAIPSAVPSAHFAIVYMGLEDRDNAFLYLEKARQERSDLLTWARLSVMFDPVRSDKRFEELLRAIGLSDTQIQKNE